MRTSSSSPSCSPTWAACRARCALGPKTGSAAEFASAQHARQAREAALGLLAHVVANDRAVVTLERDGGGSVLVVRTLADGREVARHALSYPADVVKAVAIAGDAALIVTGDACLRFPLAGGAPGSTPLVGAAHVGLTLVS